METRLNDLDRKEIAQALQEICVISDIDAPSDLGAVINYMQRKFRTNLSEIQEAMDFWITNENRIIKPRRLNVKFVSDVLNLYRGHKVATKQVKYNNKQDMYHPTPEETEAISIKAYKYAFQDYYHTIKTNSTKLLLKSLDVNCDYAVQRGWVKNTWSDEQLAAEEEWLRGYEKRYFESLYKDETNPFKRIQQKFVSKTDFSKCVVMSLHFRDRIARGHVPEEYQNNPLDEA